MAHAHDLASAAIRDDASAAVAELVRSGGSELAPGVPALCVAANYSRFRVVASLIEAGVDVMARYERQPFAGWTALHFACLATGAAAAATASALVTAGASTEARTVGDTPGRAARRGGGRTLARGRARSRALPGGAPCALQRRRGVHEHQLFSRQWQLFSRQWQFFSRQWRVFHGSGSFFHGSGSFSHGSGSFFHGSGSFFHGSGSFFKGRRALGPAFRG